MSTRKRRWVRNNTLTRSQVGRRLGRPTWPWSTITALSSSCGLSDGKVATAGYGDAKAAARVWLHADGVCVAPALQGVESDEAYAAEIARRLHAEWKEAK